jgi:two-component system, OmpR family, sensor histidine kinase KdpD
MNQDDRPNPDALLKAIKKEEAQAARGKLRVFLGMAAGVGKTYAMLKAAQDRLKEGVNVIAGVVETHGRTETEALLTGLQIIPKKEIDYRGTSLQEMDLDAILARKPGLVLVDELAHTNAPGSRHPKRWQDVDELLATGIDVYTTINVQHLESRKDAVEGITGIVIRETVPDSILERAAQVDLIDLSPADLLKRLREGKVYLGEKAQLALENFFKEDRLTALREIALRLTAERVDVELQGMAALLERRTAWNTNERLMVAVSPSPHSERNIRATRRLAFTLGAPWIAAYIDTGVMLNDPDRTNLSKNLDLARELGGEVVTTTDPNLAEALQRLARQKNVSHLVMGRPYRHWWRELTNRGTLLDRLVRQNSEVDVHVIRVEKESGQRRKHKSVPGFGSPLTSYAYVFTLILTVMLISFGLQPLIGYRAVGFLFLLAVLILSLFMSIGPILFAAVLSALLWDYLFIPPPGTFFIRQPEDVAMTIVYFLVALIAGTLTHRMRSRERLLRREEERLQVLYELVREIAGSGRRKDYLQNVTTRLGKYLNGHCGVLLKDEQGDLVPSTPLPGGEPLNEKNQAVARWALDNGKPAGWSTDTLASAEALYLPLRDSAGPVGIFIFQPKDPHRKLLPDEENIMQAAVQQLGGAVGK